MATLQVRAAGPADFVAIEALVTGMFHDLGTADVPDGWGAALDHALATRLGRDVAAFVTVPDPTARPVAVALGVVDHRLPSPRRIAGRLGYVEWLATDPAYRRRGAARLALAELLAWFDAQGIDTVDVLASEAARPLYLELGFAVPAAVPLRRVH